VIIERKSTTKIEFLIKAKSNFKAKSTANNVEVIIIQSLFSIKKIYVPVPDDAE
jgi:AP-1 complex subunit mu